jgi:hypothetical protein
MTAVIRRKTWEQRQDDKITAEYVRLSNENRALKIDYNSAMEQLHELQIRIETVLETLKGVQS